MIMGDSNIYSNMFNKITSALDSEHLALLITRNIDQHNAIS